MNFRTFPTLLLSSLFLLTACSEAEQKSPKTTVSNPSTTSTSAPVIEESIILDTHYVPGELPAELLLLEPGVFHGDEIDSVMQSANYFAVVKNVAQNKVYMQYSIPKFERVEDPIVDEIGQKSGINVIPVLNDSVMYYISNHPVFSEQTIEIPAGKEALKSYAPGDSFSFEYHNVRYTLWATGHMPKDLQVSEYADPKNYKLFVSNGSDTTLLFAFPQSHDYYGGIQLIADFDHDQKPDFIINTSYHYNSSDVTLYLSSFAPKGQLVTPVAQLLSVGC